MVKKKSKKVKGKKTKKELLKEEELETAGRIFTTLDLETIVMKKKRWQIKIQVGATLPRTYHRYKIVLTLDEEPYLDRIAEVQTDLDNSLFKNDKAQIKDADKRIAQLQKSLDSLRGDCEVIEFSAVVESLKYRDAGTLIELRIPDDVVEPFNRQKMRMDVYSLELIPEF